MPEISEPKIDWRRLHESANSYIARVGFLIQNGRVPADSDGLLAADGGNIEDEDEALLTSDDETTMWEDDDGFPVSKQHSGPCAGKCRHCGRDACGIA